MKLAAGRFRTPRAQRRERIRRALRVGALLLAVVLVVGSLMVTVRQPWLRVADVAVQGNRMVPADLLIETVQSRLTGMRALVLPRDSTLYVGTHTIEQALLAQVPRLRDVEVRRSGRTGLAVVVTEREPYALWCGDVVPPADYTEGTGACLLMDAQAFLFARAAEVPAELPRLYGAIGPGEPIGQFFMDSAELERVRTLWRDVEALELQPHAVLVVDEHDIELTLEPGKVLVARTHVAEAAEILAALIEDGQIAAEVSFVHLDLRFTGKAFLKRTDTDAEAESARDASVSFPPEEGPVE